MGNVRQLPEYRQCQEVDDKAVDDVNQDIYKMIAKDIEFSELVIEGQGKIHNGPRSKEFLKRTIISKVSNTLLIDNLKRVIKNKREVVDIAVDDSSSKGNNNQCKPQACKLSFQD